MLHREQTRRLSRRAFLKLSGLGAVSLAVLAGERLLAQSLDGADRLASPLEQIGRYSGRYRHRSWDAAVRLVRAALTENHPSEIAFLLGPAVDPLVKVIHRLSVGLRWGRVLRWANLNVSNTLRDAAQRLFGTPVLPCFDLNSTGLAVSFGIDLREPWLAAFSPQPGRQWVHFGPRRPKFDAEWVPLRPGAEIQAVLALGRLVEEMNGEQTGLAFHQVDPAAAAASCGLPLARLSRLAERLCCAPVKVAIPGRLALGGTNGLAAAQTILALNATLGSLDRVGGLYLPPDEQNGAAPAQRVNTLAELRALITAARAGEVKTLFLYGIDPVRELPPALDIRGVLPNVPQIIQIASGPEDAFPYSDWLLPASTQDLSPPGPFSATSVFIAAARLCGDLAAALPFQGKLDSLRTVDQSFSTVCRLGASPSGWSAPVPGPALKRPLPVDFPPYENAAGFFRLLPVPSDGESEPDHASLNPLDLLRLGIQPGRQARLTSTAGEALVTLRCDPGLLPGLVAFPAATALQLLEISENEAGDWAFTETRVRVAEVIS